MATAHDADPSHSEKEHHTSPIRYWAIWVLLLILTATTIITGHMDLGPYNLPLAMLIATVKATMVVLFFMHLAEQKGANRIVFTVSIFFVVLLIGVTLADVGTRFPLTNPPSGQNLHAPAYRVVLDEDMPGQQVGSPSHESKE